MSSRLLRTRSRLAIFVGLLIFGALDFSIASATELCVNSAALLDAALAQASLINQPYTIKMVQGTYALTSDSDHTFLEPFTLEGGYTQNCVARVVDSANTVINIGVGHVFNWEQISGSPTAEVNIEGVTFSNATKGMTFIGGGSGTFSNDEGKVHLKQVRFTQILQHVNGIIDPSVQIKAFNASMNLENVLFDHGEANGTCGVLLGSIGHSTVSISHVTADLIADDDFCLSDDGSKATFSIANSVLWSSDGPSGLPIFSGVLNDQSAIILTNDIYSGQFTLAMATVQNQINADPLWINPAASNYRLQNASPAVNSGTLFPPNGEPATDIEGHARIVGSAPDRGAHESLVTDQTTFFVTNTNDTGAGSLRDAINLANNNLSQKLIKFDIRNPANVPICPAVIALNATLPIINSRMTIDGYTQPTSTKNTSPDAFNANLCVIIKPAAGTLASGFTVPPNSFGSLVLRGVGMGGFGQPIRILGGQSSQISGNQFGGSANGVALPGAGINAIVFASGASGNVLVGGSALGDRNVIGGAANSGIDSSTNATTSFTTCQIVNNLIGLAPDGITGLANSFGINSSGSGCQIVGNRIAGNAITNLWIQGSQTIAQQNRVGFNIQNNGFATNTYGILVTGSSNIIGAGGNGGSITANTVRLNFGGGVVVKGDAGGANSINANLIYDNGVSSDGMDIDLYPTNGTPGPTPNDDTDFDSGPNDLQNFPVPKSLIYTAAVSIDRPATLSAQLNTVPGTYRVDVYFSNAINTLGKRGHAQAIVTHTTVQVPFSGTVNFSLPILVPNQNAGGVLSMTATNSSGSTSEIGTAMLTDTIFADGFD